MRKLLSILFVFLCMNVHAQENLVLNGSFEQWSSCPGSGESFTQAVDYWQSGHEQDSPDYFNQCSALPALNVPDNWRGWQTPFDGDSYAGIWVFSLQHPERGREYIQTELSQPLYLGLRYEVS
ncbi:MAG: hypothetical protein ACPGU4_13430, partial [Flavobacteriales bacterium]